jgi:hypothetical protein
MMSRLKLLLFLLIANAAQILSFPTGQPPTCC